MEFLPQHTWALLGFRYRHFTCNQEQWKKLHWIGILGGIEEVVGQRKRGEGQ